MRLAISCAVLAVAAHSSLAIDRAWMNPSGGLWGDPANWQGAQTPSPTESALFDIAGSYQVTSTSDAVIEALDVRRGDVTLAFGGATLRYPGQFNQGSGLHIGADDGTTALLRLSGTRIETNWTLTGACRIGAGPGERGEMLLDGPGSAFTSSQAQQSGASIGQGAYGRLSVRGGALFSVYAGGASIGVGSNGVLEVDGAGSRVVSGSTHIGVGGHAVISNGGSLYTALGFSSGGLVEVRDPGSAMHAELGGGSGDVYVTNGGGWFGHLNAGNALISGIGTTAQVGTANAGSLRLEAGATMTAGSVSGGIVVTDPGTTLTTSFGFSGSMLVTNGATATVPQIFQASLRVEAAALHGGAYHYVGNYGDLTLADGAHADADLLQVHGEHIKFDGQEYHVPARYAITSQAQATYGAAEVRSWGTLSVASGGVFQAHSLTVGGAGPGVGTLELAEGIVSAPSTTVGASGELTGAGSILGDVVVSGAMRLDGELAVDGNAQLNSGSLLECLITASEPQAFGHIEATGLVTLGGLLRLTVDDNASLQLGQVFPLVSAEGFVGNFSGVQLPTLPNGWWFELSATPTSIDAQVVPAPNVMTLLVILSAHARRRSRVSR